MPRRPEIFQNSSISTVFPGIKNAFRYVIDQGIINNFSISGLLAPLAVQAAKEKAVLLTTELGTKIGRVYAITENSGGGFPVMYRNNMMNKMGDGAASYEASGPTIAAGQITVSATVEASFVIEQ